MCYYSSPVNYKEILLFILLIIIIIITREEDPQESIITPSVFDTVSFFFSSCVCVPRRFNNHPKLNLFLFHNTPGPQINSIYASSYGWLRGGMCQGSKSAYEDLSGARKTTLFVSEALSPQSRYSPHSCGCPAHQTFKSLAGNLFSPTSGPVRLDHS